MATSPQRRHIDRPSPLIEKPPERRQTSAERGYGTAWTKYAANLRLERVFCECCMEAFGIETGIAGQTTTESGRKRAQGVVDHILPVSSASDTLFWMPENHWAICVACNSEKSIHWDGTYGKAKVHSASRDLGGVMQRRRDVIAAMRKASEHSRLAEPQPHVPN